MMKQRKSVPKRRFNKFEKYWRLTELDSVVDFFNNMRIPIDTQKRIQGIYPYYGATGIIDYVNDYIFQGEYVLLAEDGENILSRNSPLAYLTTGKFWVNNHAHIMNMKSGSNLFLIQLLDKQEYNKYNSGTAQPKLNGKVVRSMTFYFPSTDEQQKIGLFFKYLDEMITLEQRKIDKTRALKSAYLAEMFPAEGERVPKRRFAGFTDEWRKRSLGDLTKINTGASDLQDSTPDGKYPFFVRSQNIQRSNRYIFDGEAILIPGEGRLGEIYHYIIGKFDYHQRVYKISNFDEELDGKFTVYTMHKTFKKHALKLTVKATVDSLRLPMLTEYNLMIPTLEEQVKIGKLFTKLDSIIITHQQKLDKLQETKQAYLHEMLV